ncbi:membrane protein [Pseudonocardia sulfidoxydans NBRC 16205]|uniref:Membrane protein n=1 Tax=Pseudonocardia sulfidoxydans NBRC 16205 TaxID=1223511 RepID=A0A511DQX3_9PSEU|nr:phosphatase PAP2 family protein [Pseudonocardia sulfidoxydans]GEL25448.1 membrane protein [Pseudonocardia sulfidoxydans NBRC 16205]
MTGAERLRSEAREAVTTLRWDRVVLPRPLNVIAVVVIVPALVVLVVGAVLVAGHDYGSALDERIEESLGAVRAGRAGFFPVVIALGNVASMVVLVVVVTAVCLAVGRPRIALLALFGPALTGVLTSIVLKPVVGRTLDGADSYPSGHTGAATALTLVVALLLASAVRATAARIVIVVVLPSVVAATMATALVVQNVHYPTDTVGGACTALVAVLTVALVIDRTAGQVLARRAGNAA